MFISISNIVIILIFGTLYFIGMFMYANQQGREWYKQYDELNERYKKLYEEYKKLLDEKFKEKINNNKQNNSFISNNRAKKQCQICKSTENVKYYPTDGYEEFEGRKTFYSGGFYMCDNCLNACEFCDCGKLKTPFFLEKYIGGFMQHQNFCKCNESTEQKKARNIREFKKYEQNCYNAKKSN